MSTGDTDPASNDAGLGESGGQVKPLTPEQEFNVQLEWLKELGADLRARTQAEYLYTAAALALFGGVIAAQQSGRSRVLVAFGVVIVAGLIVWKIIADHETYRKIWKARGAIIERLEPPPKYVLFPKLEDRPPKWWVEWGKCLIACNANRSKLVGEVGGFLAPHTSRGLRGKAGYGYRISILVVLGAALFAFLFCLCAKTDHLTSGQVSFRVSEP